MSLMEKMKLFSGSQEASPQVSNTAEGDRPVMRRKNKRAPSRFKTQVRKVAWEKI